MLNFYFNGSPNPTKVALFLEEAGLAYTAIAVDTRKGEQFAPAFVSLNPNAKVPVIEDDGAVVFDSNAILLYLAEKTGKFLPQAAGQRGEMLSWLMFIATGIGPYSGQAVHFVHFATEHIPYAQERYLYEVRRHYAVLDARLATRHYLMGDSYTLVDMAMWCWARMIPFILGDGGFAEFPHVKRLTDEIAARPAAVRAVALKDQFAFKAEMDAEARAHMFKHAKAS